MSRGTLTLIYDLFFKLCSLGFSFFFAHKFPFCSLCLFSSPLHLLYPPLQVLIARVFCLPALRLFLLLLTNLHSYFSFLRSSLTNSPFFHRLVFFFSFSQSKQILIFFLRSIIAAWRALKQPCYSQSSWPNEDENAAAYSCICQMYSITLDCAQHRQEISGILSMSNDYILRIFSKQLSPSRNTKFTSLS